MRETGKIFFKKYIKHIILTIFFPVFVFISYNNCGRDSLRANRSVSSLTHRLENDSPGLLINEEAQYTKELNVNLKFIPGGNFNEMFVSFDPQCLEGSWETLKATKSLELRQSNQTNTVYVRYRVSEGEESSCVNASITHDGLPPELTLNSGPASRTSDITPDFKFTAVDTGSGVARMECRLDNEARFSVCQSEFSLSNLSDGSHTLKAKAVDHVDFESPVVSHSWIQDVSMPTIALTSEPSSMTQEKGASFVFSGVNGSIVSYECQFDGGGVQTCSSPHALRNLSEGRHRFLVVGVNSTGRRTSPVVYSWFVDSVKPVVSITSGPDNPTVNRNASFSFSASDSGSGIKRVECRLDSGSFSVCQGSVNYTNLSEGEHRFTVRAWDKADNPSVKQNHEWSIAERENHFTYYVNEPHIVAPEGEIGWEGAFNVVKINNNLFRGYAANAITYLFEGPSPTNMTFQGADKKVIGGRTVSYTFYCNKSHFNQTNWKTRSRDCGAWLRYTERYGNYIRGWAHVETNCCYSNSYQTYGSVAYVKSHNNGETFQFVSDQPFFPQDSLPPEYGKHRGLGQVSLVNAKGYLWAYVVIRRSSVPRFIRTVFRAPGDNRAENTRNWKKWINGSWRSVNDSNFSGQFTDYGAKDHGIFPGYDVNNNRFVLVGFPGSGPSRTKGIILSTSHDGLHFSAMDVPLIPRDSDEGSEKFKNISLVSNKGGNRYENSTFLLYYAYVRPGETNENRNLVYRRVLQVPKSSEDEPDVKLLLSRYRRNENSNWDSWTTTTYVPSSEYQFVSHLGYILTEEKEKTVPLFDCALKNNPDEHVNRASGCWAQEDKIRTLGYIFSRRIGDAQAQDRGLIALYRCYDPQMRTFFTGTGSICDTTQNRQNSKYHLGYIYPPAE